MSKHGGRKRLAAVLGLLGSDHDGEALSAARMAERMRRELGVTWAELLGEIPDGSSSDSWRALVCRCDARKAELTSWEAHFLAVIRGYRTPPTARQMQTLEGILRRLDAE